MINYLKRKETRSREINKKVNIMNHSREDEDQAYGSRIDIEQWEKNGEMCGWINSFACKLKILTKDYSRDFVSVHRKTLSLSKIAKHMGDKYLQIIALLLSDLDIRDKKFTQKYLGKSWKLGSVVLERKIRDLVWKLVLIQIIKADEGSRRGGERWDGGLDWILNSNQYF